MFFWNYPAVSVFLQLDPDKEMVRAMMTQMKHVAVQCEKRFRGRAIENLLEYHCFNLETLYLSGQTNPKTSLGAQGYWKLREETEEKWSDEAGKQGVRDSEPRITGVCGWSLDQRMESIKRDGDESLEWYLTEDDWYITKNSHYHLRLRGKQR